MDQDLPLDSPSVSSVVEDFHHQSAEHETASPAVVTDKRSEGELPEIMASLGLNENIESGPAKELSLTDDMIPRRSQRKRVIPRASAGGISKRRCILRPLSTLERSGIDSCFQEDDARDFYVNFNKNFKRLPCQSLETIYEEPVEKNGSVVLSGPKKKRFLPFSDFVTKAKRKSRQLKIKSMLVNRGFKKRKSRFTIEDVKKHLAESGILM